MGKDGFDASLGLAFGLELFKRYRKNGILMCEMRRIPGFSGPGTACLELVEGTIVSSYIEDKNGHHPIAKHVLIQLDGEKGPFEWRLVPSPSSPPLRPISPALLSTEPRQQISSSGGSSMSTLVWNASKLVIVAPLKREQLYNWTSPRQQALQLVWNTIDGRRSVQNIKAITQTYLSGSTVDEIVRQLIEWKVVVIIS